jgi:hypothetical protein
LRFPIIALYLRPAKAIEGEFMSVVDFEVEAVRLGLPLLLKSKAAAKLMACGQTKLRELINDGHVEGYKRGKDLLVRTSSVLRFNAGLPPARFTLPPKKSKDISTAA